MQLQENDTISLSTLPSLSDLTKQLGERLVHRRWRLTTAESCTGGKLASALCAAKDTPEFYGVGYITFTNEAKARVLGVKQESLARYTAVSERVVTEMAVGARERAGVDISIAVSGYGGPEGGEDGTPAGTVWFAWDVGGRPCTAVRRFEGDCEAVLDASVCFALGQLLALLPDDDAHSSPRSRGGRRASE
ncbi:2-oxo-tetronate isomerase [Intestinirhabdus alba]|jgi:PncC family amidohydrolase|uniref:2-oxo-tetronate isomerase n=1 Tax=Intestinirhabdus alba TaxID=2899544 RepID=A0A6L6IGZ2_9ENTR|nr:2-oxo-tetronate isomerase [Intestinirhabdus alba]MTH46081.1 2-oxo-tetronate isomerase [Intestinirhabdus alba]